jgi:glycosyltransferase involved in cell wall biosynthesis
VNNLISPISTILRAATRKENEPLNILTFPTHERYESNLTKTRHRFYAYRAPGIKDWNKTYAPLPENYELLPTNHNFQNNPLDTLPKYVEFDLILSQNKAGQFQIAKYISQQLYLPLISMEHTLPPEWYNNEEISTVHNMSGNINIFISEYSKNQWRWPSDNVKIIPNTVDTNTFKPLNIERGNHILNIGNDVKNRDYFLNYSGWKRIVQGIPNKLIGDNPGLSKPAKSVDDLVFEYNTCGVYLNTTTHSSMPTVILESMACGTPTVSTATCGIPELIDHGVNGFLSNDEAELKKYCVMLLKDKELAKQIGSNARQKMIDKFGVDSFISKWHQVFQEAICQKSTF